MKILGIIPARYASSRFPAKVLADINGKTMIRRVYEQVQQASLLTDICVATDHPEIAAEIDEILFENLFLQFTGDKSVV